MGRQGMIRIVFGVLLGIAAVAGVFLIASRAAHTMPGGEALRYPWEAMRSMVVQGEDPYAHWQLLYAWTIHDGGTLTPQIYPLHTAVVFFLPLALIRDFMAARALAMVGLWLAWAFAAWYAARAFGWRGGRLLGTAVFLFGVSWFFSVEAWLRADVIGLVLALEVFTLASLTRRHDRLAGVWLALTLIKPLLVWPAAVFLLFWAVSRRRWGVWLGFWGTTAVLFAFSWWLLPGWPLKAVQLALQFPGQDIIHRMIAAAAPGIGRHLGWLLMALLVGFVLLEWSISWGKPTSRAVWMVALTLWGSLWWSGRVAVADHVLLLIPLGVVWLHWSNRWKTYGRWAVWGSLAAFWLISWALWWPHGWHPQALAKSIALHTLVPLLVWPLLYSVRWWATRTYAAWEDTLPLELL